MEFGATGETIAQVPEPATVWLMLAGLGFLGLVARRRGTPNFSDVGNMKRSAPRRLTFYY